MSEGSDRGRSYPVLDIRTDTARVMSPTISPPISPSAAAGIPISNTAAHAVGGYAIRPRIKPASAPTTPRMRAPPTAWRAGDGSARTPTATSTTFARTDTDSVWTMRPSVERTSATPTTQGADDPLTPISAEHGTTSQTNHGALHPGVSLDALIRISAGSRPICGIGSNFVRCDVAALCRPYRCLPAKKRATDLSMRR